MKMLCLLCFLICPSSFAGPPWYDFCGCCKRYYFNDFDLREFDLKKKGAVNLNTYADNGKLTADLLEALIIKLMRTYGESSDVRDNKCLSKDLLKTSLF